MSNQYPQCEHGLLYNGFSVILIQSFVPHKVKKIENKSLNYFVDNQIFLKYNDDFVTRYELPDFNINIKLFSNGEQLNSLYGKVKVHAAIYFNQAVSLTYRIVVDNNSDEFCHSDNAFDTDQLILLSGIIQGTEHWGKDEKSGDYVINNDVYKIEIDSIAIEGHPTSLVGNQTKFVEIQEIYKSLFIDPDFDNSCSDDYDYTYIDIWESISHGGDIYFESFTEAGIIEHIDHHHRSELIGLMSLYPYEWPYRAAGDYKNICGSNIAIDTDDLVLTNENITLVVGTYGLRGTDSPTEWNEYLKTRSIYHTSWIEYFRLVELAIVRKCVTTYVLDKYNENIQKVDINHKSGADIKDIIHENAVLNIRLTSIITKLNVARYLRYMSHKHMYRKCCENIRIEEDIEQLEYITNNSFLALNNANNVRELKQASQTNFVLGLISVASLFEIILSDAEIPLLKSMGSVVPATRLGRVVIYITVTLIFVYLFQLIKELLNSDKPTNYDTKSDNKR